MSSHGPIYHLFLLINGESPANDFQLMTEEVVSKLSELDELVRYCYVVQKKSLIPVYTTVYIPIQILF